MTKFDNRRILPIVFATLLATTTTAQAGSGHEGEGEETITLGNFYLSGRPDAQAPVGVMGDHTHNTGDLMLSYRYMQMHMERNRDGTNEITDDTVREDFMIAPTDMDMEMHMFGAMYGLTDDITVMAMLPYIQKDMLHRHRNRNTFGTVTRGFGDLKLSGLYRLYAQESSAGAAHRFHANFGVGLPTGGINETGHTLMGLDQPLPYPMQLGSGTVDLFPGGTYTGRLQDLSWGLQYIHTLRLGHNDRDYSLGDERKATGWVAYQFSPWFSSSFRLDWKRWDNIDNADVALNPAMVPTARTDLRAGRRLDTLIGVNIGPQSWGQEHIFSIEFGVPAYQDLHGPQLQTDWLFTGGWRFNF